MVKEGDTVRIHYVGKLEDGSVFDSTEGGASLEFKVGDGEFLQGIEKGVLGMEKGQTKTVLVPAEQGYGPHLKERVFEHEKKRFAADFNPVPGEVLQMYRADGMPVTVTVLEVTEDRVVMDCNHPLAGKNLIFDITLETIL